MTESPEQAERLDWLIEALKTNKKRFAEAIGVSPSFIYQIVGKEKEITARVIVGISRTYPQVNLSWLFDGIGDPFNTKTAAAVAEDSPAYGFITTNAILDKIKDLETRLKKVEARKD